MHTIENKGEKQALKIMHEKKVCLDDIEESNFHKIYKEAIHRRIETCAHTRSYMANIVNRPVKIKVPIGYFKDNKRIRMERQN